MKPSLCYVGVALLFAMCAAHVQAQVLTCDAEAFKNRDEAQMSREYRAAFLKSIDRQTFEQMKSSSSGGGGLNIAGIRLGGNASYEDFEEKRDQELTRLGYQQSRAEALQYVRNSFDGPGAKAYNACVAALVALQHRRGLFMWLEDVTDDAATVKIHWRPTAGVRAARVNVNRDVQLIGSTSSLRNFPAIWPSDTEREFIFRRLINREFRFVVNISGDSASVMLPRKPTLAASEERICRSVELVSREAPVSASRTQGSASRITDGNSGSAGWNSGEHPPQWVEIELPQSEWIHHIMLLPLQNPEVAQTQHQIIGIRQTGEQIIFNDQRRRTANLVPFRVDVDPANGTNIKKIRVQTIASPSWVAWSEIEVWACR